MPLDQRDEVIFKNIERSPFSEDKHGVGCHSGSEKCKQVIKVGDVLEAIEQVLDPSYCRSVC